MIELTKLNNETFFMNPHLIEVIERIPNTIITMTNGKKYIVLESVDEITAKIMGFYKKINGYHMPEIIAVAADETDTDHKNETHAD
ncbi:MAG: hypothetical protein BGN88_08785 [Clostridiales bacterium 43-6]|nr:MAG: hypothetical protein BGN88_08785 [Clostridiales bacterium 43-6]